VKEIGGDREDGVARGMTRKGVGIKKMKLPLLIIG